MRFKKFLSGVLAAAIVVPTFALNAFAAGMTNVYIPYNLFGDSAMANYMKTLDPDQSGSFSYEERLAITEIDISGLTEIQSVRLSDYLPNLKKFVARRCGSLDSIDFSNCHKLEYLDFESTQLKSVKISGDNALTHVDLYNTKINSFDYQLCPNLVYLDVSLTNIDQVNIINHSNLQALMNSPEQHTTYHGVSVTYFGDYRTGNYLSYNDGTTVYRTCPSGYVNIGVPRFSDYEFCRAIEELCDTDGDYLLSREEIDAVTELEIHSCYMKNLKGLELFTNIEVLRIGTPGYLTTFDGSGLSKLRILQLNYGGRLESVNLTNNAALECLFISDSRSLTSIDLSNCPALRKLNLRNGAIQVLDIINNPYLYTIYTDEYYCEELYENTESYYAYELNAYMYFPTGTTVIDTPTPIPTAAPTSRPTGTTTAPTGSVTTAPAQTPTQNPSQTPTQIPSQNPSQAPSASESGVAGFVERLYTIALDRASDPNGKADWVNRVYTAGATGADVAQGFLFSPEFLGKDMSNEDFLGVLYRVFFDRVGDQGGVDYWLGQMAAGMDKQTVIWGFINSTEWANVCLRFGIASGGNGVPNITIEPAPEIIEFATRLYTTCLGRQADRVGLMDWARQLANRQISGSQAAAGFFTSSEFVAANYSNEEYVNRLYRTFMGREADQGGFDYWMGRFAEGATREDVFLGFAGSAEWAEICSSYGILK